MAATPDLALLAARFAAPVKIVGDAAAFLAPLPVGALQPGERTGDRAGIVGHSHHRPIPALPAAQVWERLGPEAVRFWERATGGRSRPLKLVKPQEFFAEASRPGTSGGNAGAAAFSPAPISGANRRAAGPCLSRRGQAAAGPALREGRAISAHLHHSAADARCEPALPDAPHPPGKFHLGLAHRRPGTGRQAGAAATPSNSACSNAACAIRTSSRKRWRGCRPCSGPDRVGTPRN